MESEHKSKLLERHKNEAKKYVISVGNVEDGTAIVSEFHNIEMALHKIELDMMTNLHYGLVNPILVKIKEEKE
jgi:hypothetical protein